MGSGLIGQQRRSRVMRERWEEGHDATRRYKERVARSITPGMRILHAGCGWDKTDVSRRYINDCEVVGIDLDSRVAALFHSEFHLGALTSMPFEADSFDVILCEYVVEHLDDPETAFREMERVLRPGGRMLFLTPNLYSYKAIAAACASQRFHTLVGRIRYGVEHERDMYPTLYRCNTVAQFRRLASKAGLQIVTTDFVTNGPTWFEKVPIVFEIFDVFHRAIASSNTLRHLRCALILELRKPVRGVATAREV